MPDFKVPHDALILVGDGEKALFLRNKGHAMRPDLVIEEVIASDNPATREQGADRPGRAAGPVGGARRSAMEQTDWHRLGETRFATDIARSLRDYALAGRFEALVLIAPPRVLGALRKALHPDVARRTSLEIPKGLTAHPREDIQALLSA